MDNTLPNLMEWAQGAYWLYATLGLLDIQRVYMTTLGDWVIPRPTTMTGQDFNTWAYFSQSVRERHMRKALSDWTDLERGSSSVSPLSEIPAKLLDSRKYVSWLYGAQNLMIRHETISYVGYDPDANNGNWIICVENEAVLNVDKDIDTSTYDLLGSPKMQLSYDLNMTWYNREKLKTFNGHLFSLPTLSTTEVPKPSAVVEPAYSLPKSYMYGAPPMPRVVREQLHKAIAMRSLNGGSDSLIIGKK